MSASNSFAAAFMIIHACRLTQERKFLATIHDQYRIILFIRPNRVRTPARLPTTLEEILSRTGENGGFMIAQIRQRRHDTAQLVDFPVPPELQRQNGAGRYRTK